MNALNKIEATSKTASWIYNKMMHDEELNPMSSWVPWGVAISAVQNLEKEIIELKRRKKKKCV